MRAVRRLCDTSNLSSQEVGLIINWCRKESSRNKLRKEEARPRWGLYFISRLRCQVGSGRRGIEDTEHRPSFQEGLLQRRAEKWG